MANLVESNTYDAGVYQIEITDPVLGGPAGLANAPLKNLANRTKWLKGAVDSLLAGIGFSAPNDSPDFTGDPRAPTPALDDNDRSIATTAWVRALIAGVLNKSVAGGVNVSLTGVESGNGILRFTGALTAHIAVIVPNVSGLWIVKNSTTGAYTLTVKTAAGAGALVTQGKQDQLYCDGTDVDFAQNEFAWSRVYGTPTTIAGYGITDGVNATTLNAAVAEAVRGGYFFSQQ